MTTKEDAIAEGQVVKRVEYGERQAGYPAYWAQYGGKYSFRKLVASMDSKTLATRLREDRGFREAVDKLGKSDED